MADPDDITDSFLALVDEAFRRLLDEPDAHLQPAGAVVRRGPLVGAVPQYRSAV